MSRSMAILPPVYSPRAAFKDLAKFMRGRSREQMIGASLAILSTIIIVIMFFVDSKINTAPKPQVIYAESWPEDRSDEEIIAEQQEDQAVKEAREAERRRQFQELQNQLGIE